MSWVRRAVPRHTCAPPVGTFGDPQASQGDLWRCDECGQLWRVGRACGICAAYGDRPHRGQCQVGLAWRPATFWQRLRYHRRIPEVSD
jgi:hypothetical protein